MTEVERLLSEQLTALAQQHEQQVKQLAEQQEQLALQLKVLSRHVEQLTNTLLKPK